MKRHQTDVTAFIFGIFFLLAAAAALAIQSSSIGFGKPAGDTWVAAAVLLATGAVAVIGMLVAASHRPIEAALVTGEPAAEVQPASSLPSALPSAMPTTVTPTTTSEPTTTAEPETTEMPTTTVESKYGPADWTLEQPSAPTDEETDPPTTGS